MQDSKSSGKKPIKEVQELRARKPKLERVSSDITERRKAGENMSKIKTNPMERNQDKSLLKNVLRKVLYSTGFVCGKVANIKHIRDIEDWESIPSVAKVDGYKLEEIYKGLIGFTFAVEQSIDGIAIGDLESKLTYVNDAFAQMHGYSPEEMIGMKVVNLHNKEQMDEYKRGMRQIKTQGSWIGEIGHIRKDGTPFPTYASVTLLKDPEGETGGIVLVCRDITDRKRMEDALRRSRTEWENTFNAISDWVVLVDLKGRILRTNRAAEEFVGVPVAQMAGQTCCKLLHGSDTPLPGCPLLKMIRTGRRATKELQLPDSNRWVAATVDPVVDEKGTLVGAVHITSDITERKRAEETLQKTTKELQVILDSVPAGIWYKDTENRLLRVNKAGAESIGMKVEDVEGRAVSDIFPEDAEHYYQDDLEVIKSGKPKLGIVERMQAPGGEKKWVQTDKVLYRDEQGNVAGVIAFVRDITERKRAEEALRASEQRFRDVAESTGEWIWEVDTSGLYTYASPVVEKILGYKPEELVGKMHFYDLFAPDVSKDLKEAAFEVFSRKETLTKFVNPNVRKNGNIVFLETSGLPVLDKKGDFLGYRGADADITERKKAEEVLRESEAELFTVLNNIPAILIVVDRERRVHRANKAAVKFGRRTPDQMMGLHGGEALRCLHSLDDPRGCGYGPFCETCVVRNTVLETFKTGKSYYQVEAKLPFDIDGKTEELALFVSTTALEISSNPMVVVCLQNITEHKKAEEEIAGIAKFPAENPNPVLRVAKDGTIIYANKASQPLLGQWRRQTGQRLPAKWHQFASEAFSSGSPKEVEVEYKCCTLSLTFAPVVDFGYVNIYGLDITEHKKAEEAYRALVDHSLQGLAIFQDGRAVFANQTMAEINGYTVDEILAMSSQQIQAFVHPEDRALVWGRHRDRLKGKHPPDRYEFRGIRKDGTICWLEIHASRIEYQGKPAIQAAYVDVTDRKKAEEALKRTEQKIATILDTVSELVVYQDMDHRVVWANRVAGESVGSTAKELVGRYCYQIWHGRTKPCEDCPVAKACETGQLEVGEIVTPNGSVTLIRAEPVKNAKGNVVGIVEIAMDITDRKRAEERLFDDQAKLKSLASQLTLAEERERHRIATELHDRIGQSLVISKMNLEALRKSEYGEKTDETLDEICNSLAQTIADTKTLTFDLSSPILYELGFETAVAEWLAEQIRDKHGIATQFEDDGQPKLLDDDIRVLLFRDVRELLINVVRHAWADQVKVSIRKFDEQICVSVEDDGVGFDPAEAASTATKRAEFGLFSIRQRLKELGGHLEIKSEPGRGCKVTMTAPLKK